jgi:hypothetical protein
MSLNYYQDVRHQAQQSFASALAAAVVGVGFFVYAAWQAMRPGQGDAAAIVPVIAGALVQIISGINFLLYGRAARQFAAFHVCLERTNRFLLANTLCENLNCHERRDAMRSELIRVVANAPMLTLDVIAHGADSAAARGTASKSQPVLDSGQDGSGTSSETQP